jgi:hypothetical protein
MTSRILTWKKLLAGLLPLAAAAAMIAPGSAMAYSRGFDIFDLSRHPIKLLYMSGDGHFEGRPADGAVLEPGKGHHRVEVQWRFLSTQVDTAHYEILGDSGQRIGEFDVTMRVGGGSGAPDITSCRSSPGACRIDGTTASRLDPAGTVIDIPAEHGQAQADALKSLCQKTNAATCTFTPTHRDTGAQTGRRDIGKPVDNTTNREQLFEVGGPDTVGITDSLSLSLSTEVNIADVVSVGISATYGHEWTKSHTFTHTVTVTVPAHHTSWLEGTEPVIRDTGHFTMTLGNTTWKLHGVSFDSPNPNGNGTLRICERADAGGPSSCEAR